MCDEERQVQCGVHGYKRPAFVCRHLARGSWLGFVEGQQYPANMEFGAARCAWCDECEKVRRREGGWNDRSEDFAGVTLICEFCFEAARERNALR